MHSSGGVSLSKRGQLVARRQEKGKEGRCGDYTQPTGGLGPKTEVSIGQKIRNKIDL